MLKTIWINLNCNELVCDGRYFYFNSDKLRIFKGKLKKLKTVYEDFKTIEEARHKRKEILNHPKLICTPYKPWIDYEGEFWFTYTYPNPKTDYLLGAKVFLDKLTVELKNSYPNETFILDDMGGSLTEKFVHVYCNKSLSEKFSLYPREEWSDLKPDLISYWIP
ncbi:MAG: hypothetical protein IM638_14895 [Bacteroidetes bacterium]|nr:hypothetical protein [Bacteroidota bacterium]